MIDIQKKAIPNDQEFFGFLQSESRTASMCRVNRVGFSRAGKCPISGLYRYDTRLKRSDKTNGGAKNISPRQASTAVGV